MRTHYLWGDRAREGLSRPTRAFCAAVHLTQSPTLPFGNVSEAR
jgi:hypothetical protein